ncbi:hypothetical protein ABT120_44120 [Nonomuraea angiospora]|uniref:hypothetical protein n=1 Tax=Nonomuraea angiospora TaxID=46172 RepID=UPI00331CCD59
MTLTPLRSSLQISPATRISTSSIVAWPALDGLVRLRQARRLPLLVRVAAATGVWASGAAPAALTAAGRTAPELQAKSRHQHLAGVGHDLRLGEETSSSRHRRARPRPPPTHPLTKPVPQRRHRFRHRCNMPSTPANVPDVPYQIITL